MAAPTPDDLRGALAGLDTRRQKIVAGLFTIMVQNAGRVRDQEWISQQLAEVVLMAGGFDADDPDAGVAAVEEFLQANAQELLSASYLLFQRVALDLEARASEGFTFDEALALALEYLPA